MTSHKSINIEHDLDVGTLTITSMNLEDDDADHNEFHFLLETTQPSEWFYVIYDREDLIDMCAILGEPDELMATLQEPPSIKLLDNGAYLATFSALGRKRTYPLEILLNCSSDERREVIWTCQRYVTMRDKVTKLQNDIGRKDAVIGALQLKIAGLEENLAKYKAAIDTVVSF